MNDYDECFTKVGKWGKYQMLMTILIVSTSMVGPIILLSLPINQSSPDFYVNNLNLPEIFTNKTQFCDEYYYNEPFETLNNKIQITSEINTWASQLKFVCNTKKIFSLTGTVFFLGNIASNLAFIKFSDRYGRRKIYVLFNFVSFIALAQLIYLVSYIQIIICAFLMGITSLNLSIVAVYLNETIDKNKSGVIMGITNSMFPLVGLINLGVMFYLKNWLFMYIFILILNIATNVLGMLYMEESTAWLNANKKVKQLLISFENISKLNDTYEDYKNYLESSLSTQYFSLAKRKKTDEVVLIKNQNLFQKEIEKIKEEDDQNENEEEEVHILKNFTPKGKNSKEFFSSNPNKETSKDSSPFKYKDNEDKQGNSKENTPTKETNTKEIKYQYSYSVSDLFTFSSVRIISIYSSLLWVISGFSFFGILLNLEGLTGNIVIDSLVTYSAEFIAEILSGYLALYYGRRKVLLYSLGLSTLGVFVFLIQNAKSIFAIISLFLASLGIASAFNILYIYTPELYPTNTKNLAMNTFSLFNRLAGGLVPVFLAYIKNILFYIFFGCILGLFSAWNLPDTTDYNPGDEIEEVYDSQSDYIEVDFPETNSVYLSQINKIVTENN